MSTVRFAKPASAQYSDLFIRRSDSVIDTDGPVSAAAQPQQISRLLGTLIGRVALGWHWIERKRTQQNALRRLRVAETISLGEKRFVSIIEVNGAQYLIGGAANHITLLAALDHQSSQEAKSGRTEAKGCEA